MTEFNLIPVARSSPTECGLCKDNRGPFIDTGVERYDGRLLICTSITGPDGQLDRAGCIEQMARLVGSVDKETHAAVLVERDGLRERTNELEQHIANHSGSNVIPADDVANLIGECLSAQAGEFSKQLAMIKEALDALPVAAKKPAAKKAAAAS